MIVRQPYYASQIVSTIVIYPLLSPIRFAVDISDCLFFLTQSYAIPNSFVFPYFRIQSFL